MEKIMDPTSINNIKLTLLEYASSSDKSSDSNLQESGATQVHCCYDYVVVSIKTVTERLLAMPKGSWVFFDLDDTLLTVDSKLVEEEMVTLISDLKMREIHALSLTRRLGHDESRLITMEQLRNVEVVFSRIFPENGDKSYTILKEEDEQHPGVLENGVAFASDFGKESILQELLKLATELKIDLPPEIALIDDLIENISDIKQSLKNNLEYNIPFLGIHYTAVKERSKGVAKPSFWEQSHRYYLT
jgi:hypothetical protein